MRPIEFLQALHPEAIWSITAIEPVDRDPKIVTRAYPPDQVDRANKAQAFIDANDGENNLYYSLARLKDPENKKASLENVADTSWLHVDIDARPGDLLAEMERIEKLVTTDLPAGIPTPTWVIYSGGGYQVLFEVDQPIPIYGCADAAEEVAKYNKKLEAAFGGDSCSNVDRILRLPGTTNVPSPRKVAKGRVPKKAEVVAHNASAVRSLSAFTQTTAPQRGASGLVAERVLDLKDVDLDGTPAGEVAIHGHLIDEPDRWPSRSEALFYFVCEAMRQGVPEAKILGMLLDPTWKISDSVLEKKGRADAYARKQIESARENVHGWLAAMNSRFAFIADVGNGMARIIYEDHDETLDRWVLKYQDEAQWKKRFANKFVTIPAPTASQPEKMVRKSKADAWLTHPKRREFERITFWPEREVGEDTYNLWGGFAKPARPSGEDRHPSYLRHLYCNICREQVSLLSDDEPGGTTYGEQGRRLRDIDPEDLLNPSREDHWNYWYLIHWLARAVQEPAAPGLTAVAIRGRKGSGKSFFAKHFGKLFGRHFMTIAKMHLLTGQFTGHLRDLIILFGDEAVTSTDPKDIAAANGLITDDQLVIEQKGKDPILVANFLHLILATDSNFVAPAGENERRYFVLDVSDTHHRDIAYFGGIAADLDAGGYEDLLAYLQNLDLSNFDVWADMPETDALKKDQQTRWWIENCPKFEPIFGWFEDGILNGAMWDEGSYWVPRAPLVTHMTTSRCSTTRIGRVLKESGARQNYRDVGGDRIWYYVWDHQLSDARARLQARYPRGNFGMGGPGVWPGSETPF